MLKPFQQSISIDGVDGIATSAEYCLNSIPPAPDGLRTDPRARRLQAVTVFRADESLRFGIGSR